MRFSLKEGALTIGPVIISIPIPTHKPCYKVVEDYTCYGDLTKKAKNMSHSKTMCNEELEQKELELFMPLIIQRREAQAAKAKFKGLSRLQKKFPQFSRVDLEDMKSQFTSYDLNHDGLIDFPELIKALDELGDSSPHEMRRQVFDEIDVDGSDSVDFEEFLGLVQTVTSTAAGGTGGGLEAMFRKGKEQSQVGRNLSLQQQMEIGLF